MHLSGELPLLERLVWRREIEPHRHEFRSESADSGSVATTAERIQPGLRVVVVHGLRPSRPPVASDANPQLRIRFQIQDVRGMPALLGNDPTCVPVDQHPDDVAPLFAAKSPLRLD